MTTAESQAGQKRSSAGADIGNDFTPKFEGQPGDESEPARKKARVGDSTTDDGSEQAEPLAAQEGWNGSVSAGLRTSFGGSTKFQKDKPAAVSAPVESQNDEAPNSNASAPADSQDEKASDRAASPGTESDSAGENQENDTAPGSAGPPATESSSAGEVMILDGWTIPKGLLARKILNKPDPRIGDGYDCRLKEWYAALFEHNKDKAGLKDPAVVLPIWRQWLEKQDKMSEKQRARCLTTTLGEPTGENTLRELIKQLESNTYPHNGWTLPPPIDPANFEVPARKNELWIQIFAAWLFELGKLNPSLGPMNRNMEKQLVTVYREWVEKFELKKRRAFCAYRGSNEAFFTQRDRMYKIIAGEISADAPQPKEVIVLSSSSEGEVSEEEQESTPAVTTNGDEPSPEVDTAMSENVAMDESAEGLSAEEEPAVNQDVVMDNNAERLTGQVLYNWNRVSRLPQTKADEKRVNPKLPVWDTQPITLMSPEEELEYRAYYYPGVQPDETFCLNCTNYGHTTRQCPLLTCRWCREWGHPYTRCPTRLRCTKCKQIGHPADTCTEKLVLPRDQMDCARCGAKEHLENACYEVFRSTFTPTIDHTQKVKALPIYCGTCGSEGHYWTECGLNARWVTDAEKDGLTSAEIQKFYVDPSCDNVAICHSSSTGYQIRGAAAAEGRPPHLNGKSIVPQRHVEYFEADDDDEDEVQFIRPPPKKPRGQQPGKITFASFSSSNRGGGGAGGGGNRGRGGGGGGGGGRGGGQSRGGGPHNAGHGGGGRANINPPLPPGPPPSSSKPSGRDRDRRRRGGGRGGRGGAN